MKKLLLISGLLVSLNANAEAWFAKNKSGGEIVITNTVCVLNGQTYNALMQGHTRTPSGEMMFGCWYYDNQMVYMVYEDRSKYSYPVNIFQKMEQF